MNSRYSALRQGTSSVLGRKAQAPSLFTPYKQPRGENSEASTTSFYEHLVPQSEKKTGKKNKAANKNAKKSKAPTEPLPVAGTGALASAPPATQASAPPPYVPPVATLVTQVPATPIAQAPLPLSSKAEVTAPQAPAVAVKAPAPPLPPKAAERAQQVAAPAPVVKTRAPDYASWQPTAWKPAATASSVAAASSTQPKLVTATAPLTQAKLVTAKAPIAAEKKASPKTPAKPTASRQPLSEAELAAALSILDATEPVTEPVKGAIRPKPGFFAKLGKSIKNNPYRATAIIGSSLITLASLGLIALCVFLPPAGLLTAGTVLVTAESVGFLELLAGLSALQLSFLGAGVVGGASMLIWDTLVGVAKGISLAAHAIQAKRSAKQSLAYEELSSASAPQLPLAPPTRPVQPAFTLTPNTATRVFVAATTMAAISQQQAQNANQPDPSATPQVKQPTASYTPGFSPD